jgi:hypothetical protein
MYVFTKEHVLMAQVQPRALTAQEAGCDGAATA